MQYLASKKNKSRRKGNGWGLKPKRKRKQKNKAPAKPAKPIPGIKWEPSVVTENVSVVSQARKKGRTKQVQVEIIPRK